MGFGSFLRKIGNSIKTGLQQIVETGREICNNIKTRIDECVDHYNEWKRKREREKELERQQEQERERARQRELERLRAEEQERERQRLQRQIQAEAERKERERLLEIKEKYNSYKPSKPDQKLAHKAKEYLERKFPNGIKETMRNVPPQRRETLFNEVVADACEIMEVKIDSMEYEPMADRACGFYRGRDNSLHLNSYMVTSSHPEQAEEQIYTVFHELIHARQHESAFLRQDYGYSPEQCLEWATNFRPENYVKPEESDEGYRKQPLERDAYGFEAIIKGHVSIEDFIKASQI